MLLNQQDAILWTLIGQTLFSGFQTKGDSNQSPQLQRQARNFFRLLQVLI